MKLLLTINPDGIDGNMADAFRRREAARAVILDTDENIALLAVTKSGYHKLPGGGIEEGEDTQLALARECMEEVGCKITVTGELGSVREVRAKYSFVQDSYAYLAKVDGEKGAPDFTESELERGFEIRWMQLNEALDLLSSEQTDDYDGQFIVVRDLAILKEAALRMKAIPV